MRKNYPRIGTRGRALALSSQTDPSSRPFDEESLLYTKTAVVFLVSLSTLSYFSPCQCSVSCETSPVTKFVKFLNCISFLRISIFHALFHLDKMCVRKKTIDVRDCLLMNKAIAQLSHSQTDSQRNTAIVVFFCESVYECLDCEVPMFTRKRLGRQ